MSAPTGLNGAKTVVIRRRGFLLVLSSPSGAGKTTITRRLLERDPSLALSVSVTTRPRRPSEIDGRDYHFIERATFDRMVQAGELLEHANVFGHSYGTPRAPVDAAIDAGRDIVTDIDWQGTQQISGKAGADIVTIFVLPPSKEALEARLRARAQDSAAVVAQRMAKSAEEMSHWAEYAYVIVNDELDASVAQAQAIVTAERLRRERQIGLAEFVTRLRAE
jgi:guanylate kinase